MSKIIYLIDQPLDEWNYGRFGIQTWIDRGWEVEVWDLTLWAHPLFWQHFMESGRKLKEFAGYFPISLKSQLDDRFSKLEKVRYFIDLTGDNFYSVRVKMRLIQMGAIRVVCATGSIPVPGDGQKIGLVRKLIKAFAKSPIKPFKWLANALVSKLAAPYIWPGLFVVSGEKSIPDAGHDHEILKAHNLDYDTYLKLNNSMAGSIGNYAVFIDQNYCFHPEYILQNTPCLVTPEKYFPAICNGLRKISDVFAMDLRVAAHPRASYQQDYFAGIPVEYGGTAELIRNCKIIVCHDSTAIQFAVLFGKPVIFVTTDELDSIFMDASLKKESIAIFATELGKSVINLDHDLDGVDWQNELRVDSKKYNQYRNKYIKIDGSPEILSWDVVINHVEKAGRQTSDDPLEQSVFSSGTTEG